MTTSTGTLFDHRQLASLAAGRAGLMVFAGTLLVSASLLFSVQPLFAKMVLPHLGGSPSVWAVAMCFFQAALLAGYCYAHALNRFAKGWLAPAIHLGVCTLALFALPFALPEWANEVPSGNTYLWLVAVLAVGVGLPFFATSANAPLLQAWFARSGHPHAADPYFLYGASNLGSLVSLLAYPFLIEPMFGLDTQRTLWTGGFVVLIVMLAACGVMMLAGRTNGATEAQPDAAASAEPITFERRLIWIGLAFVPSALLVAFTTHITTDIASAPFLWVIPLATFLGTFVIVFRDRSMIPHHAVLRAHPFLVASAILFVVMPKAGGPMVQAAVGFATFFVTTLVCHRALYEARPEAQKLTEFYLYMSLGGVLGGMFSALIAPQLFNTVAEYPMLIILGLFARPGVMTAVRALDRSTLTPGQWALYIGPVAALLAAMATGVLSAQVAGNAILVVSLAAAVLIALYAERTTVLALSAMVAILVTLVAATSNADGYSARSFFGVSRVLDSADGRYRMLVHGSTAHGGQKMRDESGALLPVPQPIMYYHPQGPMVRGFDLARGAASAVGRDISIAVIGLGGGSLACSKTANEKITFFEIDPVVVDIAHDPKHFTFLSRCAPNSETILGDARLTLAKQPAKSFDFIAVDAFSSDAVPVHLLTREALDVYLSRLSDGGLLAFHISNRHMELESVVVATAEGVPGLHMVTVYNKDGKRSLDEFPSHVVYLSRDPALIETAKRTVPAARDVVRLGTVPWSDNYADVLSAIWRKYTR